MSTSSSAISTQVDVNSPRSLFAAIYLGVIGASVFIVQPGFIQGLVQLYGFSEQQAGYTAFVYAATVCVYNFAWNMSHPFLLAGMASFDRHGRVVVYAVAAQMLGLAVGPAFAASLLTEGDYSRVITAGITLFLLSYMLILIPLIAHKRQSAQLTGQAASSL